MARLFVTILIMAVGLLHAGTIPFDPSRGLVEVEVTINGRIKGVFGIDTGADQLYIDREFAAQNNLTFRPLSPRQKIVGIDGGDRSMAVSLSSLQIADGQPLRNIAATAIDMGSLDENSARPPDGLIGHEILRRYYLTIDYPNRTMLIESSRPSFLKGKAYHEVPFKSHKHLILVDVVINNRVTVPMILDYCASYTAVSKSLADRLGLDDDARPQRLREVRLGDKTVSNEVPVTVLDFAGFRRSVPRANFEGILGGTFLQQYKISIDYARRKVYIHK